MNRSPEPQVSQPQPIPHEYQQRFLDATHNAGLGIKDLLSILESNGKDLVNIAQHFVGSQLAVPEDQTMISMTRPSETPVIAIEDQNALLHQVRGLGISLAHILLLLKNYPTQMKDYVVQRNAKKAKELAATDLARESMAQLGYIYKLQLKIAGEGVPFSLGNHRLPETTTELSMTDFKILNDQRKIKTRSDDGKPVEMLPTERRMIVHVKTGNGEQTHPFIMVTVKGGLCIELRQGEEKLFV